MTDRETVPQPCEGAEDTPSAASAAETPARPEITLDVERGAVRLLMAQGLACVSELPLPDGRRADIMALSQKGEIWIVEVKSSIADFRADRKWMNYRAFCDRLLFAVAPDFPAGILPEDTGLIVADRYGGAIVRDAPEHPMAPARRKALTLRFAFAGACRAARLRDPALPVSTEF